MKTANNFQRISIALGFEWSWFVSGVANCPIGISGSHYSMIGKDKILHTQ